MRGDGRVFAITGQHRDFPLSRRIRATLSPGRGGVFLPHVMGKWADAQHRVEGAARQRRTSGFAGPSVRCADTSP